jgi:hypothetical protein
MRRAVETWRSSILERGLLDEQALAAVESWPDFEGATLIERLYRSGLVSEGAIVEMLVAGGAQDGTSALSDVDPPPAALGALTRDVATRCRAVPFAVKPPRLLVGMLDPADTSALEEMSFLSGLVVEPRAIRPSVLFGALAAAYDAAVVKPEVDFRARALRTKVSDAEQSDLERSGAVLPAPGVPLPDVKVRPKVIRHAESSGSSVVADPGSSPLAAGIVAATGDEQPTERRPGLLEGAPPSAPRPPSPEGLAMVEDAEQRMAGRDSLPPQVLPVLSPPFRCAVLFLVRDDVAVGWDGKAPGVTTSDVRGVLLPLTGESAFGRAREWGMVAAGTSQRPTTIERMFFRFLRVYPPETFAVLPIVVGDQTVALLYVDVERGPIEEEHLASAKQVGQTLAEGLAPLVSEDQLFGPQDG